MIHVDTLQLSVECPPVIAKCLVNALSARDGRLHAVAGSCLNGHLKMAAHWLEAAYHLSLLGGSRKIVVVASGAQTDFSSFDHKNTLFVFKEILDEKRSPDDAQSPVILEALLSAGATVVALFHANTLEGVAKRLEQVGLGHRVKDLAIDLIVTRGDLLDHEPAAVQKKTSELVWLDIQESFKEESALASSEDSFGQKVWLGRRQAILVPAFPVVVFLEAAGIPVSGEDLMDINRLDVLLAAGLRAHGALFRQMAHDLQAAMCNLPGYSMSASGQQSESTASHHGYALMGARHLFGRSDRQFTS